jgi:hypothetical protein
MNLWQDKSTSFLSSQFLYDMRRADDIVERTFSFDLLAFLYSQYMKKIVKTNAWNVCVHLFATICYTCSVEYYRVWLSRKTRHAHAVTNSCVSMRLRKNEKKEISFTRSLLAFLIVPYLIVQSTCYGQRQ